ncbi:MAG: hypothetical protein LBS22_04395, partial [Puniceicoccales bacterium]|nr:hypothetical protein [Puniceicoccales bacterium]
MNTSLSQKNEIASLRNQARSSGTSKTATIQIDGRWCTVTAKPIGNWPFKRTNIKIESRTLDNRTCIVNFTYDRGRGVAQGLRSFTETINKSDQEFIAETTIPQVGSSCSKEQVLSTISSKIAGYTQPMPISSMSHHAPRIWGFLRNVENFVLQNALSADEISKLKQELRHLSSTPIIQYPQRPNDLFSINECDGDPHCRDIALQAESLEILLDAKACGQVRLERNIPPAVKVLGRGSSNTVCLAHRKPGGDRREASEPIALKPCIQSKQERNPAGFVQTIRRMKTMIGIASGSYRRNQATSMVQRMFEHIGKTEKITVPHVIATVSAAE